MSFVGKYSISVPDCTDITVNTSQCNKVNVSKSPKSIGGRRNKNKKKNNKKSIKNKKSRKNKKYRKNKKGGSCFTNGYNFDMINTVGDKMPAVVAYNNCPKAKTLASLSKFDGINLNRNLPVESKACGQKGGKGRKKKNNRNKRNSVKNKNKNKKSNKKKSKKKKKSNKKCNFWDNFCGGGYNFNLTKSGLINGQSEVVRVPQCEASKLNATRFTEHPPLQTGGVEFNFINNPETGKKVSIYGKTGKKVLNNYVKYLIKLKGGKKI